MSHADNVTNCLRATQVSPECPVQYSIYGYRPSLAANAYFVAWFGTLLSLNLILGFRYRTWTYMLALSLGSLTETIGYIGRVLLYYNAYSETGFEMQICCLILGPAFNSAAIYLTLKHIALTFGPEFSFVKPRLYTYVFISGDLLALVLQGIGGGLAATAYDDVHQRDAGTDVMLTGISWQVVTIVCFGVVISLYIIRRWRARHSHPLSPSAQAVLDSTKFRLFAFGVASAFLTVFARCVYRIAELHAGWASPIMRDEPSYIALEGAMIAYASFVQTVLHPGFCFPQLSSHWTKTSKQCSLQKPDSAEQGSVPNFDPAQEEETIINNTNSKEAKSTPRFIS